MVITLCNVVFGILEVIEGRFGCNRWGTCSGDISRVLCEGLPRICISSVFETLEKREMEESLGNTRKVKCGPEGTFGSEGRVENLTANVTTHLSAGRPSEFVLWSKRTLWLIGLR
jgi:hypothetical protein